ncbi:MAG: SDR family NAD(P)-dependent oxidoreductase [Ruegeria sp.]
MELGLRDKSAIVTAASRVLGLATARSLAREGVNITMNARAADALEETASGIRSDFDVEVKAVAADFNEKEGRDVLMEAAGIPDILVNNPGVALAGAMDAVLI